MNKEEILKHYYGYDSFRPAQAEIIETILSKRDVLAIMPTSAGKSICFQVPALMLDGITIVVSPLISLMYDQVTSLKEMGIQAILLNSAMTSIEYYKAIEQLQRGEVKLLYVAPERFEQEGFLEMMQGIQISMVAVDEAHCISQWGQDFRPSYQNIDTFVAQLPTRPIVAAFTATATPRVRMDIKQQLKLQHPFEVVTSFDRANLYFGMEEPRDKMSRLLELIKEKEPTIVFCNTRKEVEKVCDKLQKKGIASDWYHAGLSSEARSKVQEDFIFDRIDVIVATNAFGMGIDKSNVRKVIHYNMPKDIESYYQEAGRAGRDGEPAECILLYGAKDIIINKFLVKQNEDKVGMAKLNEMIDYCRTVRCLRGFMLDYFGQKDIPEDCGHCTNCLNKVTLTDVTPQAQMILSCIIRMKERYGMSKVSEVLDYLKETLPLVLEAGKTVCHGDLDRRNFLLANDKLYLIDWEMVRLADPVSDLTMILTQYIPVHQWGEWLDSYGLNLSTNIYQRIEWYALMNCLNFIKKSHFEGRYYEMNEKILVVKSIYNHRLMKEEE